MQGHDEGQELQTRQKQVRNGKDDQQENYAWHQSHYRENVCGSFAGSDCTTACKQVFGGYAGVGAGDERPGGRRGGRKDQVRRMDDVILPSLGASVHNKSAPFHTASPVQTYQIP